MTDKVLDFCEKRKEAIEKKRRSFERIMFHSVLGVYSVIDKGGSVYPVELVDISHEGCLIQVPASKKADGRFENDMEFTLRMYFTKESYVPAVVKIKYGKEFTDNNGSEYLRYGCEFDKSVPSFDAIKSFIDFLYKFAEFSSIDKGDAKVFFL